MGLENETVYVLILLYLMTTFPTPAIALIDIQFPADIVSAKNSSILPLEFQVGSDVTLRCRVYDVSKHDVSKLTMYSNASHKLNITSRGADYVEVTLRNVPKRHVDIIKCSEGSKMLFQRSLCVGYAPSQTISIDCRLFPQDRLRCCVEPHQSQHLLCDVAWSMHYRTPQMTEGEWKTFPGTDKGGKFNVSQCVSWLCRTTTDTLFYYGNLTVHASARNGIGTAESSITFVPVKYAVPAAVHNLKVVKQRHDPTSLLVTWFHSSAMGKSICEGMGGLSYRIAACATVDGRNYTQVLIHKTPCSPDYRAKQQARVTGLVPDSLYKITIIPLSPRFSGPSSHAQCRTNISRPLKPVEIVGWSGGVTSLGVVIYWKTLSKRYKGGPIVHYGVTITDIMTSDIKHYVIPVNDDVTRVEGQLVTSPRVLEGCRSECVVSVNVSTMTGSSPSSFIAISSQIQDIPIVYTEKAKNGSRIVSWDAHSNVTSVAWCYGASFGEDPSLIHCQTEVEEKPVGSTDVGHVVIPWHRLIKEGDQRTDSADRCENCQWHFAIRVSPPPTVTHVRRPSWRTRNFGTNLHSNNDWSHTSPGSVPRGSMAKDVVSQSGVNSGANTYSDVQSRVFTMGDRFSGPFQATTDAVENNDASNDVTSLYEVITDGVKRFVSVTSSNLNIDKISDSSLKSGRISDSNLKTDRISDSNLNTGRIISDSNSGRHSETDSDLNSKDASSGVRLGKGLLSLGGNAREGVGRKDDSHFTGSSDQRKEMKLPPSVNALHQTGRLLWNQCQFALDGNAPTFRVEVKEARDDDSQVHVRFVTPCSVSHVNTARPVLAQVAMATRPPPDCSLVSDVKNVSLQIKHGGTIEGQLSLKGLTRGSNYSLCTRLLTQRNPGPWQQTWYHYKSLATSGGSNLTTVIVICITTAVVLLLLLVYSIRRLWTWLKKRRKLFSKLDFSMDSRPLEHMELSVDYRHGPYNGDLGVHTGLPLHVQPGSFPLHSRLLLTSEIPECSETVDAGRVPSSQSSQSFQDSAYVDNSDPGCDVIMPLTQDINTSEPDPLRQTIRIWKADDPENTGDENDRLLDPESCRVGSMMKETLASPSAGFNLHGQASQGLSMDDNSFSFPPSPQTFSNSTRGLQFNTKAMVCMRCSKLNQTSTQRFPNSGKIGSVSDSRNNRSICTCRTFLTDLDLEHLKNNTSPRAHLFPFHNGEAIPQSDQLENGCDKCCASRSKEQAILHGTRVTSNTGHCACSQSCVPDPNKAPKRSCEPQGLFAQLVDTPYDCQSLDSSDDDSEPGEDCNGTGRDRPSRPVRECGGLFDAVSDSDSESVTSSETSSQQSSGRKGAYAPVTFAVTEAPCVTRNTSFNEEPKVPEITTEETTPYAPLVNVC